MTYEDFTHILDGIGGMVRPHPGVSRALNRALAPFENLSKMLVFSCNMCGQCVLHETGFVCIMNCPKQLRDGPCGGVRMNGHCEVKPEMRCVWMRAEASTRRSMWRSEIFKVQRPLDWRRRGSSAILNAILGYPFNGTGKR